MSRGNGKSEREAQLDPERELPSEETAGDVAGSEVEALRDAELLKLKTERDMLVDRMARMQADFENARKRAAKEQQEFREYALSDALKTLLPVLESFERALRSAKPADSEFSGGVELIYKQLNDALGKLGLEPVPAKGQQFDPRFHEAVEMVETDQAEDQEVLEELQRGYKLKDRLLRPAMVRVAKARGK